MTNEQIQYEIERRIAEYKEAVRESRAKQGKAHCPVARTDRACYGAQIRELESVLEMLKSMQ